ncbi:MAG TPA: glutamine-hydrolyzing carbamoyl-phosphate synthase small subunit [Candidatus Saccharimonadales bacterium]|jgi:carbamoyl-phosphate synthase small subunit
METKNKSSRRVNMDKNRSLGGDFFKGRLDLSDGTTFWGLVPKHQVGSYSGEIVFNTGMTGYIESLTDPSYAGQILVFTYPLIGNYGVQTKATESTKIQVSGVIVSEAALYGSHVDSEYSLLEWLKSQDIPILTGVDTRAVTKHLRVGGTMAGTIGLKKPKKLTNKLEKRYVSIEQPVIYNPKKSKTIILVDCGSKENILRSLLQLPVRIKRVPYDYDYTNEPYDGVLLSNGPGDPTDYVATIKIAKKALAKGRPVFGICLGSQIMGLAAGAKTYRLKFGHRGHNQPCQEAVSGRSFITSQNHGYAIDEGSLPKDWKVSFRNLNDDSIEGISHKTKPFFSVQFHPEACPGPTDTSWLFKAFYKSL